MKKLFLISIICSICVSCEKAETPISVDEKDKPSSNHEYVDLGLPSQTLWATCNVGASNPKERGAYFAWGETEEKETFYANNYKYLDILNDRYEKYISMFYDREKNTWVTKEGLIQLEPEDDAATVHWSGKWRTPTQAEWEELVNSCEWTFSKEEFGIYVKGPNGNSIFLPITGEKFEDQFVLYYDDDPEELVAAYMGSTVCKRSDGTYSSYAANALISVSNIINGSKNIIDFYEIYRENGMTVRPVRDK